MDKPYAVLTIPLLCISVYIATWIMVWMGIISKDANRKFWNVLLLIALAGAAGLGFLLALQVNFKFDLPDAAAFLVWHVDFGIGLLVIAIIHLSRHLKYYWHIITPHAVKELTNFENQAQASSFKTEMDDHHNRNDNNYLLLLPFCLGLTTMASQIILLREFFTVFNGNELVIGVVLANWMLVTGVGAWIGKFAYYGQRKVGRISLALLALAVLAPLTLFALDALRNVLLTAGSMAGISQVFFISLMLLSPFCLTSGFLFTRLAGILSARFTESATGRVYTWESIGSVAGGVLFNFVLVFFLRPFGAFGVILAVNAALLSIFEYKAKRKSLYLWVIVVSIAVIASIIVVNPGLFTRKLLFPGQEILVHKDTPFGNIVVTASEGQKNLFENNTLVYTTNNIITNEETVHYAMLQREKMVNVLLIGGGFNGVISEILKYPVQKLDYIEMNPWLLRISENTLDYPHNSKVHAIISDPVMCIRNMNQKIRSEQAGDNSRHKYDVIILDLPDPWTVQLNRFYTLEFLQELKPLLTPGGVFSLSLMATADYMGYSSAKLHSIMYATLKHVFRNILVVPGDRDYFLASDSILRIDIAALQAEREIETEYVNPFYLDDQSLRQRSDLIMKALQGNAPVNRNFEPLAFKGQIEYWLDYFGTSIRFLPWMVLVILLFVLLRSDGIGVGLFTAGFAASSSEIVILFAFQIIYGYVFIAAGIIITLFMLGLALGAAYGQKYSQKASYTTLVRLQAAVILYLLVMLAAIYGFGSIQAPTVLIHAGFAVLTLVIAMLTGLIFQASSTVKQGNVLAVAGSAYSADLIGSAMGSLVISTLIIPAWGLFKAMLMISGLCLLSMFIMVLKRK